MMKTAQKEYQTVLIINYGIHGKGDIMIDAALLDFNGKVINTALVSN